jgi:hypothetical protein
MGQVVLKFVLWLLLGIFVASTITAVTVRITGYTGVAIENGRYFVRYRSTRFEVTRREYEESHWRDRVGSIAAGTMMVSLFAFIGLNCLLRTAGRK